MKDHFEDQIGELVWEGGIVAHDEKFGYYDAGGIKTIEVIKAKLTHEQYKGYLLGNIIKYLCRMNWKGCAERDNEKIAIYSEMLKGVL